MMSLQPAHPGNSNALRHGAYSPQEVAAALMAAPHVVDLDEIAAVEIRRLVALIERIDQALAQRGMTRSKSLLDARLRAGGRLERWLAAFGATPQVRHLRSPGWCAYAVLAAGTRRASDAAIVFKSSAINEGWRCASTEKSA